MPEELLFEGRQSLSRSEIAEHLRAVADRLDDGDRVRLSAGERSVTLTPPPSSTFVARATRDAPVGSGPVDVRVELSLEWREGSEPEVDLEVE